MNYNSLNKALFLKSKLSESLETINLELYNQRFKQELTVFNNRFEEIITRMNNIDAEEILSNNDKETRKKFFNSLNLNRGDHDKRRFKNLELPKRAYLEDQISRLTKTFIETIEDDNLCPALLAAYRDRHIYEILYHNGVIGHYTTSYKKTNIFGNTLTIYHKEKYPPKGPSIMYIAMLGLGFAALSIMFFATVAFLGLSGGWIIAATGLFGSAIAYMGGLLYGILNDIFATKANLPYFLLGHQATQHSFFSSNKPLVQAIGWGVIASLPIAVIAALIFCLAISVTMVASSLPVFMFMLPLMLLFVPLFACCANIYANLCANKYITNGIVLKNFPKTIQEKLTKSLDLKDDVENIDLDIIDFDSPNFRYLAYELGALNDYQLDGLALMSSSKKDKANWLANGNRNLLGYIVTPLIAISSLVLMLTLTGSVPMVMFSPLVSVIIPLVSSIIALGLLSAALTYVAVNKDKQVDNRYKLFTDLGSGEKKMDELYVTTEQFMPYINQPNIIQ